MYVATKPPMTTTSVITARIVLDGVSLLGVRAQPMPQPTNAAMARPIGCTVIEPRLRSGTWIYGIMAGLRLGASILFPDRWPAFTGGTRIVTRIIGSYGDRVDPPPPPPASCWRCHPY